MPSITDSMAQMAHHGGAKPPSSKKPGDWSGNDAAAHPAHKFLSEMHAKDGGKHMHVHSHEMGHTTHHIGHEGKVEGPHEHADMAALQDHVSNTMGDGEESGGGHEGYGGGEHSADMFGD